MEPEVSIVMPCLNEARTLATCIKKAQLFLKEHDISGEVIVADNGSTDGSVEIANNLNARIVRATVRGYGAALAAGINAAKGKYVIMGDSDQSYDFSALSPFIEKLREGYDLVMGNRFRGGIAPDAMPPLHRYFGNPLLTAIGRLFFSCKQCGDFYCGLRGFRKEAVQELELQSRGMEFALEMIVKAGMHGLRITEVPTTLSPDGRDRAPHLRRYRDGWRSLRFYLLMSPLWLFGIPGLDSAGGRTAGFDGNTSGSGFRGSITFDYHTLLYSASAIVLGYQSLLLFAFAKLVAVEAGLHPLRTRFSILDGPGNPRKVCRDWSRAQPRRGGPWDHRRREMVAEWFWQLTPHRDDPAGDLLRRVYVAWRTNRFGRVFLWAHEFASGAENSARRVFSWTRRRLDIAACVACAAPKTLRISRSKLRRPTFTELVQP